MSQITTSGHAACKMSALWWGTIIFHVVYISKLRSHLRIDLVLQLFVPCDYSSTQQLLGLHTGTVHDGSWVTFDRCHTCTIEDPGPCVQQNCRRTDPSINSCLWPSMAVVWLYSQCTASQIEWVHWGHKFPKEDFFATCRVWPACKRVSECENLT